MESWRWGWCCWVILVLVQFHVNCCLGCWEQERIGLLEIKASMNHPNGTSLPSWDSNDRESDCCAWEGVWCNINTKRVIKLLLFDARDIRLANNWFLNASSFLPFEELRYLDLSDNSIAGVVVNEGFEILSVLDKLEILQLDWNHLDNSILPFLGMLSSLKSLYLSYNSLNGSIHFGGFERLSVLHKLEELTLFGNYLDNSILPSLGMLSSLKSLDLGGNKLNGSIHFGGFERLSVLDKLEALNLGGNNLDNSILPSLGMLSSLKSLDLGGNNLNGSIHFGEFHKLSNLEELDLIGNSINSLAIKGSTSMSKLKVLNLRRNNFNASIIQSLGALFSLKTLDIGENKLQGLISGDGMDGLKQLEMLYLDGSSIDKSFLHKVGLLSSLRVLSLSQSGLNGSLPDQGWCELLNLEELDLSENDLQGILHSCLGNFTSLRLLDLSFNQFTGNLALSPVASLTSLEYLLLSHNHFEIPVSLASFFNHSKLKFLFTDSNRLIDDQIELRQSLPAFQLQVLILSNCTSDKLGVRLPSFLFYQYDLRVVDLSHNPFMGMFPTWFLENNTRLEGLSLRNNSFIGFFMLPSHPNPHMSEIDVSDNHFEDQLPTNVGMVFPNLSTLNLSRNAFVGSIPASFGDLASLSYLDLSNNNLSGQIPDRVAIGCVSLQYLKLSYNNLDGQMFPSSANLISLRWLYLDNNRFIGKVPDSLSTIFLSVIDIRNNRMSGKLPTWIGNMFEMQEIAMSGNHFEGPIPVEFCRLDSLEFFDLSDNSLSGSIPSCFNPPFIRHVHLNQNSLGGRWTRAFQNSSSLVTLDLRDNHLMGKIPSWIGSLSALSILLLKNNHFEGQIPSQLCRLIELSLLDLSQNNLSGPIPPCFSNITFNATSEKSLVSADNGYVSFSSRYLAWSYVKGLMLQINQVLLSIGFDPYPSMDVQQEVEFTTKLRSYAYKGNILNYMSGVDLSCNHLTGEIPPGIGNLTNVRALNLSHNNLTGSIPTTLSNLIRVESLDLSYNRLNGRIPSQLIELNALEVFSVAHNNFSGPTPDQKAQFATFEQNSYEGNPLLCGPPLPKKCSETGSTSTIPKASDREEEEEEGGGFVDPWIFSVSFAASYVTVLLAIVAVLFINPHWRRAWFHLIEVCMSSCYYFVYDSFTKLFNSRNV